MSERTSHSLQLVDTGKGTAYPHQFYSLVILPGGCRFHQERVSFYFYIFKIDKSIHH